MPILLHRDMPGAFDEWRRRVGFPDLRPASITHYDAGQLILDAAAEGLGVAFMHDSHIAHSHDSRLVQLFSETVPSPYSYWFVSQPDALRRPAVKAFHDWLFDHFGTAGADAAVLSGGGGKGPITPSHEADGL